MIRYIVCPGCVVSRNDDDRHYVFSTQLMRLHNIKPSECIVITKREDLYKLKGIQKDLIQIFPREDGKYTKYNNGKGSQYEEIDLGPEVNSPPGPAL